MLWVSGHLGSVFSFFFILSSFFILFVRYFIFIFFIFFFFSWQPSLWEPWEPWEPWVSEHAWHPGQLRHWTGAGCASGTPRPWRRALVALLVHRTGEGVRADGELWWGVVVAVVGELGG